MHYLSYFTGQEFRFSVVNKLPKINQLGSSITEMWIRSN